MNNFETGKQGEDKKLSDAEVSDLLRMQEEEASAIRELTESKKALTEIIKRNLPKNKQS